MLSNMLKDRIRIQLRTATQTAMGETVTWTPVQTKSGRVIPLDAQARSIYMQMQSLVTHKIILRGTVSLSIGNNRLLHGSKTYEPLEPPQVLGNATVIMVKEV